MRTDAQAATKGLCKIWSRWAGEHKKSARYVIGWQKRATWGCFSVSPHQHPTCRFNHFLGPKRQCARSLLSLQGPRKQATGPTKEAHTWVSSNLQQKVCGMRRLMKAA
jgi:hypothetical protein